MLLGVQTAVNLLSYYELSSILFIECIKNHLDDAVKHHVDIKGRFVRDEFAKSSCCDSRL